MGFQVTDLADDSSTAANVLSLNSMVVPIEASAVSGIICSLKCSCVSPFQPNYQCCSCHVLRPYRAAIAAAFSGPSASQACLVGLFGDSYLFL